MGENLDKTKAFLSQLKKNGGLFLILAAAAIGVFLLIYGGGKSQDAQASDAAKPDEIAEYREAQEKKIGQLAAKVDGAGRVSVAVVLEGGFEYVYAQNASQKSGLSTSEYLTVGSGSSESAVLLKVKAPQICGIGIVCDGGNNPNVRTEIVNLISAAYGIGTNKIYVTARKSE